MGVTERDPVIVSLEPDGSVGPPMARSVAHQAPGVLHLAVSVQVVDPADNKWLLQRRAASKALFGGRWTNTCCTHPAPGVDLAETAVQRVEQEAGLVVDGLRAAGVFTYRAVDEDSGLVEFERDHVFVAWADTTAVTLNPEEIDEVARLPFREALRLVSSGEGTPWAPEVLRQCFDALRHS